MVDTVASDFAAVIGHRIEASSRLLASRWLGQLEQLVPVALDEIFPGEQLLGHAPTLIGELAAFVQTPAQETIAANAVVTARATELGRLRHAQHASVHQVLREYRVLRQVIARYIGDEIARLHLTPSPAMLIDVLNQLDDAIDVLLQTTVDTFIAEYSAAITQHAERLEGFNRMVTHELRQPLGTLQFAVSLLGTREALGDAAMRDRMLAMAERSVKRMNETLAKLVELSRTADGGGNALVQRIELTSVVTDVIEQLRDMADARGVDMRIAGPLPEITVDVARLELILINLISNAIKYCDPGKPARIVEIGAPGDPDRREACTVSVHDNGIGIAEHQQRAIFDRFYRAHAQRDRELETDGLGLGLSIVADCVDAVKGSIRVDSAIGEGTTFFIELPVG